MDKHDTAQHGDPGITRRVVLRRAAYTAPAVIAIAAAPNAALAGSGPKKFPGHKGHPGKVGGGPFGSGGHQPSWPFSIPVNHKSH